MPTKRKPKRPRDVTQIAHAIVERVTGQAEPPPDPDEGKDPTAVARGRKGGLKGGKARAEKLSKAQRSKAARKAALDRWAKTRRKRAQRG